MDYRAYIMSADGHIMSRIDLPCADDDEAKERAKQLINGHDVELWQLGRQIAVFKAEH